MLLLLLFMVLVVEYFRFLDLGLLDVLPLVVLVFSECEVDIDADTGDDEGDNNIIDEDTLVVTLLAVVLVSSEGS